MLEGEDEVFVHLAPPRPFPELGLEPLPLLQGIVELGVAVGDLHPADEELEARGEARVVRKGPGQRRQLDRVVDDKGRDLEGGLDRLVEDGVQRLLPGRLLGHGEAEAGGLLEDGGGAESAKVDPRPLLQRPVVGPLRPGRREVDLRFPLGEADPPRGRGRREDELPGERHHRPPVGVGLVDLEHGELGVVAGGDPLVAEVAVEFVDPLPAPDQDPLQVELGGDPQVEIDVEGVVVGDEGPGRRPAHRRLHHRRLHLQETPVVEEPPDRPDRLEADPEGLPRFRRDDQIEVTLAEADLGVLEAVPLLRQRAQGLGEQGEAPGLDGDLPHPGGEERPLDAQDVAQVELGQKGRPRLAQAVPAEVDLDLPARVLEVGEDRLAVLPPAHDPSGDGHLLPLRVVGAAGDRGVLPGKCLPEWFDPRRPEGGELLQALFVLGFAHDHWSMGEG